MVLEIYVLLDLILGVYNFPPPGQQSGGGYSWEPGRTNHPPQSITPERGQTSNPASTINTPQSNYSYYEVLFSNNDTNVSLTHVLYLLFLAIYIYFDLMFVMFVVDVKG